MVRIALALLAVSLSAFADDPHCPVYSTSQRDVLQQRLEAERQAHSFSLTNSRYVRKSKVTAANFIDDYIFGKMAIDGVPPADLTNDAQFLRRVSLDLTGRIPAPEQVGQFVADEAPTKRAALIDSLMASSAFVDYWTAFYSEHFEVTSRYYNFIGIPGRNLFHQYLRDFITRDRSYAEVATEMIAGTGDSHASGPLNFLVRGFQQGDPIQDTWDATSDRITKKFLGIKTECVSCHNGARHLEPINIYLTARKREEFWRQSAFLSRTNFTQLAVDAFNQQWHFIFSDRANGGYSAVVDVNNPGARPARTGGPYTPAYMFTGERPRTNAWRSELARFITSDRQFARAAVNFLWAHFFKYGIVDPVDGWDLARIDPNNPPPRPWTIQPTHPQLLEALADEFIRSNYSIRRIIRLITESSAYQLSSSYPGEWRPEYELYFAKHFPRRLTAEEIYDAVITATRTETPMYVEGFDRPLYYASQLPDPAEPRNEGRIVTFLSNFGRGDWWQIPRSSETNVLQVLYLMNDNQLNFRTFGTRNVPTTVGSILRSQMSDEDAVSYLYLSTLGRWASADEFAALQRRKGANYEQWLADIQWTLLNKVDFIFNY